VIQKNKINFIIGVLFLLINLSCRSTPVDLPTPDNTSPEKTTKLSALTAKTANAKNIMVSTAHGLATAVGLDVLKAGGTVADAAVAIQMVLNLVEPQSSGIGGGLFLVYYDAKTKKVSTIDGRETAPINVDPKAFIKKDGTELSYQEAMVGGKSVGVPGVLAALKMFHDKHGKLPWQDLFLPAINLSQNGFPISARLSESIASAEHIKNSSEAKKYFFDNDGATAKKEGSLLINPELAATFTLIAEQGIDAFYQLKIASAIVDSVQNSSVDKGTLALDDLKNYQAKERDPVCLDYKKFKICGMGPPSSGAVAVLEILGILENFNFGTIKMPSTTAIHLFAEASKIAYADRDKYLADPDFISVPTLKILDKNYLKKRASLMSEKSLGKVNAGSFETPPINNLNDSQSIEKPSTTHFSVVDSFGNALALTSSIEYGFGSALMTKGFLLNNQLTDFSFSETSGGKLVANRIEPNKRPRSSMSPILVFNEQGDLYMVIGSPGGAKIIGYVAKTIFLVLEAGMTLEQAINYPHFGNRNGALELEENSDLVLLKSHFESMGHEVKMVDMNSGIHAIMKTPEGLTGVADKRREGTVLGE